ncbi:hypothetical protein VKT23_012405 [Stygiomarasmius scandens]|uniref:Uncharacterized protein n=1 Tax=Marasmiellus scandens TaxID=2682957 RepID=A0ABR1J9B5_9AGAR
MSRSLFAEDLGNFTEIYLANITVIPSTSPTSESGVLPSNSGQPLDLLHVSPPSDNPNLPIIIVGGCLLGVIFAIVLFALIRRQRKRQRVKSLGDIEFSQENQIDWRRISPFILHNSLTRQSRTYSEISETLVDFTHEDSDSDIDSGITPRNIRIPDSCRVRLTPKRVTRGTARRTNSLNGTEREGIIVSVVTTVEREAEELASDVQAQPTRDNSVGVPSFVQHLDSGLRMPRQNASSENGNEGGQIIELPPVYSPC